MKLHYKGEYNLDENTLPCGKHKANAVAFKEAKDTKSLGIIANTLCAILTVPLALFAYVRCRQYLEGVPFILGCFAPMLTLFPHEFLHALCFKGDVYLYTNFKQGLLFVVGTETMSKSRFIFMSLLPNIVFGLIPYLVGMLFPQNIFLVTFGVFCLGMGAGDYYNVFNALSQMPKGARTYLYQFNSYWYMP